MFRGRRAWFSQSVSPGPRELWVSGGGVLTHWQDADYLFSSDAAHPDTRRIHESLDYLEDRATVFHSRYLSASTGAGAKLSVVLGHFILPPACLQEGQGKKNIKDDLSPSQISQPTENLVSEPEAPEEEEDALDLAKSEEDPDSRAPSQGEFQYRALQEYPSNNMVTGYASAHHMRKYEGELRDFTPGTSGYEVYWIHNEISLCPEPRTRTKRKL
ncbi:TERB2 protein, partial [Brachypteracias leptosomus]|nr:TERB2 protein [Brachypteracias leptosomus]